MWLHGSVVMGKDLYCRFHDAQLSEKRRKRPRRVEQEFIKQEGWKFMKNQNEQTISGLWTKHEHYIFVASVDALRKTNKELNAQDILELYKSIQQIIERDGINVVLSNKTHSQVNCKLSQYKKEDNAQQTCGKLIIFHDYCSTTYIIYTHHYFNYTCIIHS